MKDKNTDYNLLDLIEKSSQVRQQSQPEVTETNRVTEDLSFVDAEDSGSCRETRPLSPVTAPVLDVKQEKPSFVERVKAFFKDFPNRAKTFFKTLPERTALWWEGFKPRFVKESRLFFKHIHWQKLFNRIVTCLLYPLTLYIVTIAVKYPAQWESLYADGLNYVIRLVLNLISSLVPFALSDVGTWVLIAVLIGAVAITIVRIVAEKHGYRKCYAVVGLASGFCVFLAVVYFVGQLFFGFNAYRKPLDQLMNMPVQQATTDELVSTCENLIYRATEVRQYLAEDSAGAVDIVDRDAYLTNAAYGFQRGIRYFGNLSFQDSMAVGDIELKMSYAKFTNFSWALNWQNRDGCYQPYTAEILINKNVSDYQLPATVNYYTAASMGFTDPEACSFIAFLAGVNHSDPYYNYSGLMYGLSLVMEQLYVKDYAAWAAVRASFSDEMKADIASTSMYNWFVTGSEGTGETDSVMGTESEATNHGMAVDLILSYYREGYMKDIHVGLWQPEETEDVTTDPTLDITTDSTSDLVTE